MISDWFILFEYEDYPFGFGRGKIQVAKEYCNIIQNFLLEERF